LEVPWAGAMVVHVDKTRERRASRAQISRRLKRGVAPIGSAHRPVTPGNGVAVAVSDHEAGSLGLYRERRTASLSASRAPMPGRLNGHTATQIAQLRFSLK